jgi:hypothetical protein
LKPETLLRALTIIGHVPPLAAMRHQMPVHVQEALIMASPHIMYQQAAARLFSRNLACFVAVISMSSVLR